MRWPLVLATALLCACTTTPTPEPTPEPEPTSEPTDASTPRTEPPSRPITIAVAGDVHFEGALRSRLADPATALAPVTGTLAAADLAIVNLETSIGTGGRPDPTKRFTFQAPPAAFRALADAGIDVATMANNHALDFGREPLAGMFAAIDRAAPSLTVVGVGRDADEAFTPALTDVRGTVVATLGATQASLDPTADPTDQWAATATSPGTADAVDPRRLLQAVADADASADVVVVYVHWGVQGEGCPTTGQQDLAARLVDAGADVVVGSHAHRLQGDGRLGPGYVAYGLGNYAWYIQDGATATTGLLTLTVRAAARPEGRARVVHHAWEPARIGSDGLPRVVAGPAAARFEADLISLRRCAGLAP
ncbi:CapA family protein [Nocardioides currus]|uniref:Poly-gamma-glutamate biosynthesis protein n=1 Tax=Nocardioides currus TaxID=2133958 RepID=A0A2R7YTI7_9ACTN|nr:CapA family protein [Nocardioides currus]PUA79690.1 poly-gamma-glutamate biosynthesis protein [Nocardioides currus]